MSHRINGLVRDAAPIGDDAIRALDLDGERELMLALLAHERPAADVAAPARTRRLTRTRVGGLALAGAVAVGAFALAGVQLGGNAKLRTGPEGVWAAQALKVAHAVPRIAFGEEGWRVVAAGEFGVDDGEMQLVRGRETAKLVWRPRDQQASYVEDRSHGTTGLPGIEVLGSRARLFRYHFAGTSVDDLTAIWGSGSHSLELRVTARPGGHVSDARFVAVLQSLKLVSVDQWLGAMPASVVQPNDRAAAVHAMLRGVPLPRGFDAGPLSAGEAVRDRYQLGAAVSGAVACAWIGQWVTASRAGDDATAQAAADALATSHDWAVLNQMRAHGDYPEVLWELADAVTGVDTTPHGSKLNVAGDYREALGC